MHVNGLNGRYQWGFWLLVGLLGAARAAAGCFGEISAEQLAAHADGIFRGTVLGRSSTLEADGRAWTHWRVRVDEAFKGTFPEAVLISAPLGEAGTVGNWESDYQWIGPWEGALFMVKAEGGRLSLTQGLGVLPRRASESGGRASGWDSAIVAAIGPETGRGGDFARFSTDPQVSLEPRAAVTPTGFSESNGVPARLLWADRGARLPVIVDMDYLPAGMSSETALAALQNALDAWAAVSSLEFSIEAVASFGMNSESYSQSLRDSKLYVQLHDAYGKISNGSSTLGVGGGGWTPDPGVGGTIKGLSFDARHSAFVVMDHDKSALRNAKTFEEVLTHEIGHALGLAHTSEDSNEPETARREAVMYWQAHSDGRGAALNSLDIETIRKGYPIDNLPPFGLTRSIAVVTAFSDISGTGINDYDLASGDLDGDSVTAQVESVSDATFSYSFIDADTLRVSAGGAFNDNEVAYPGYFSWVAIRISDGADSVLVKFFVRRIRFDGNADGFSDLFYSTYLASAPAGDKTLDGDYDGDGISNAQEFKWALDPAVAETLFSLGSPSSGAVPLASVAGVPYVVMRTSDFSNWSLVNAFSGNGPVQVDLQAPSAGGYFYALQTID